MSVSSLPAAASARLPVTVLSGLPGVGKTTLLAQLLARGASQRLATLSSDPADPAAAPGSHPPAGPDHTRTAEKIIRLATAAGCHELRADLLLAAGRMARAGQVAGLLIENPGRAAVQPVGHTFSLLHPPAGLLLPQLTQLRGLATVVAADGLLRDLRAAAAAGLGPPAEALVEQVEQATVLVLHKTDLAPPAATSQLRTLLRHLNPAARLVETAGGQLPPGEQLAAGAPAPAGPPPAHGIRSGRFRDERPFHPERLWQLVQTRWPAALLRSQGLFWLASRPEDVLSWQQVGAARRAGAVGTWWAAVPDRHLDPGYQRDARALQARWHPRFQDRVNSLRFVGLDLDEARWRAALTACLCTPLEISRWQRGAIFTDPWPRTPAHGGSLLAA